LADLPVDIVPVSDVLPESISIVEGSESFEENALMKAKAIADASMALTLADDSGLEVDALHGAPGPRSARFAHDRATDAENNAALLSALAALEDPGAARAYPARFRCVLALVDPYRDAASEPIVVEGRCEGAITRTPRG